MTDFVWPTILLVNAVLVLLVGVLVLWKIHKDKKAGYPTKDERTIKITGRAAIGTYYISLAFMVSLALFIIFGTEFLDLPELDAGWAIIAIMLVSGISNALLSWYYSRKGDL
ncbi:MAG: efflux RND transporter permease subunit [Candidatus Bathyarchaeota archaeon]|nr:efflux RND transporter permease subunit [Candidatus Bathyarchaeum sp.]